MGFSKLTYLKKLRGREMKPNTFRVLLAVFNYTNERGQRAYPGSPRLAEDCCTSEATVNRSLKELVEVGWLQRVSRGGRSGDGTHWAAEYALATPRGLDPWDDDDEPQPVKWEAQPGKWDDVNLSDEEGQHRTYDYPSDHKTSDY